MLRCPRCNAPLKEHLPDLKWKRYFKCADCEMAFHIEVKEGGAWSLKQGRKAYGQFEVQGAA
jgi:transposase-like protein